MKKSNILLLIGLIIAGCQSGDTGQLVTIENKYSVSLPSFLVKASTILNEDASLQYLNNRKEFYVMVFDESKSEIQKILIENNLTNDYSNDIKGYSYLFLDGFDIENSRYNKSIMTDTLINKMPARVLSLTRQSEGVDAYISFAFFEGKERFYRIMAWTINKESNYKEKMEIINSLKEL